MPVWVWAIAGAQFLLLLATSTRYGYDRDELYFIVAGSHPAFGYPTSTRSCRSSPGRCTRSGLR